MLTEKYEEAQIEVIQFDVEDIITTSCTGVNNGCEYDECETVDLLD